MTDTEKTAKTCPHEIISMELFNMLPKEQVERVFNQYMIDIMPQFLGFITTYKYLSQLIPKHCTIVDLGCAYNAQCFLFTEHKKYIAVDSFPETERFISKNCEIKVKRISEFIKEDISELNMKETFAILNYVPMWGEENKRIVQDTFENLYVYYPHGGDSPNLKNLLNR